MADRSKYASKLLDTIIAFRPTVYRGIEKRVAHGNINEALTGS